MKNLRAKYRDKLETVFNIAFFVLVVLVLAVSFGYRMYIVYNNPPTHMVIGDYVYKIN